MKITDKKSVAAALGAAVAGAAASALLFLGAGTSHASFDPQPDPPGQARGFNPQPEPPTRHAETLNPPPGLKVGIAKS